MKFWNWCPITIWRNILFSKSLYPAVPCCIACCTLLYCLLYPAVPCCTLLYPAVPCCTCCNCCTCCRVGISLFCSFALSLFTLVSLYLKSNKKKMSRFLFLLFRTLFIKELLLRVGFAPFLFSRWIISVGPVGVGVRETKMLCSLRCCKKSNLLLLLL